MNYDQCIDIVELIMRGWSQAVSWDDKQVQLWVDDLAPLDFDRAKGAWKACRDQYDFPPSWAQFKEAYRTVTWQALAPERQPAPKELGVAFLPKQESLRRLREVKKIMASDRRKATHIHTSGAANCPTCGKHDRNHEGLHKPEHCTLCKQNGHDIYEALRGGK